MHPISAAPGVFVTFVERHYAVAGTSARHLMEAARMMSPRRAATHHVAYTDWQIGWSFTPREAGGDRFVVGAVRVEVEITRTLPRWRPPEAADRALVSSWAELVAAIATHEQGHVDIAVSGARALHEAILEVGSSGLREDLEQNVAVVAESGLAAIRSADFAYDEATGHGALQGVRVPW
jgi:predicted secreted Zn-dependent protease